jgi:hypothetical protein
MFNRWISKIAIFLDFPGISPAGFRTGPSLDPHPQIPAQKTQKIHPDNSKQIPTQSTHEKPTNSLTFSFL